MIVEKYQNVVIGSGVGGKLIGWTLAKRGQKTAVIERSMIGGSCPNVACLPSKNVIYSAKAVSLVDPDMGLGVTTGAVHVDMAGVARRKRQMVNELIKMHRDQFENSGAELIMGEARFTGPRTVEVAQSSGGSRQLRGDRVFLGLGSRAVIPQISGLVAAEPMTHVEALNLERLPDHLVVIGGGYVGLEFAQAMRRFGSRVTVIQRGACLLEREDPDVAAAVQEMMHDEGIKVLLHTEIVHVEGKSGQNVAIKAKSGSVGAIIEATDILIAAGRQPNTDGIHLAKTGVELDSRGYICVDDRLRTTAPAVWAVGDCAGSPQFTHVGEDDFRIVMSDIDGDSRTTHGRIIPYCLFTDPEVAHVGMTETEAKEKRVPYRLAKIPMSRVLRTHTLSETRGFVKALVGSDDRILGFTVFGVEASEMMAVVQTAMIGGLPYTALRDAMFAHPTAAEGLIGLFSGPFVDPEWQ